LVAMSSPVISSKLTTSVNVPPVSIPIRMWLVLEVIAGLGHLCASCQAVRQD
jgi:hypothetical protein